MDKWTDKRMDICDSFEFCVEMSWAWAAESNGVTYLTEAQV